MEPNTCPHCQKILSDETVTRAYHRMQAGKRKTHGGGRKPKQDWAVKMNVDTLARIHANLARRELTYEPVSE